jgi:microcystin-dependent protein
VTEPFIGQIILVGFNFAPRNYAQCSGQIMSIASNTALFSLLGTTYGGNGVSTFALPNLNGRVAVGQGQSPGTSNRTIGSTGGAETATLGVNQMPPHTHTTPAAGAPGVTEVPGPGVAPAAGGEYGPPTTTLATGSSAGGGQPFSTMPPFQVCNYCIALYGIFPSRN